jgi:magnesium transporter
MNHMLPTTLPEKQLVSHPLDWLHVVAPDVLAIKTLETGYNIPAVLIRHALDEDELPRVERANDTLLIVLRVPQRTKASSIPYNTMPLSVILTCNSIVTICRTTTSLIPEVEALPTNETTTEQQSRFVLLMLQRAAEAYLQLLREINLAVDGTEAQLQRSLHNNEVLQLLTYQKCLTYFTTALKLNALLLEQLQQEQGMHVTFDREHLEEVLVEMRQAIIMTEIASNILSQMMDAFASIISNNLNVVMKFLTALTIVLTFPTIIASFYGMNVPLPFQHTEIAFVLTLSISLVLSLLVGAFFWRKGWL